MQALAEQPPTPPTGSPSAPRAADPGLLHHEVTDRLSSPEQVSLLLRVTDGKGWLALLACGLIAATALAWGLFGRVPTGVTGNGVLLPLGGLVGLTARADGQVTTLEVKPGARVTRGQVVARLAQPDLVSQIDGLRQQLRELQNELPDEPAPGPPGSVGAELRDRTLERQRARLRASISAARALRDDLEGRLVNARLLQKRGLLAAEDVQITRQKLREAEAGERALRAELNRVAPAPAEPTPAPASEPAPEVSEAQAVRARIAETQAQITAMEQRLTEQATITSPHTGRLVELRAGVGDVLRAGQVVASVQRIEGDEELEAVLYLPAQDGKRVRPGMAVEVMPAALPGRARLGAIVAVVQAVGAAPASRDDMIGALHDGELAEALRLGAGGAPVAVRARLRWDPTSPSGYQWTLGKGPDVHLTSGTRITARIVTRHQRPLALVFPRLDRGN